MKKAIHLLLCSAILASICNPAKASPVKEKETIVLEQSAIYDVPTVSFKLVAVMDINFCTIAQVDNVAPPIQSTTIQLPATVIAEDQLAPDERIRLHRHYFNPEDNKEYPEYKPDKLSDGYTTEKYVPAR